MKKPFFQGALVALSFSFCVPAHAWFPQGHSIIATAAVDALPPEMPSWFKKGKTQIAHDAQDPDVQKSKDLPYMTEAEAPQHFIDLELLQGRPLPVSRKEFYKLCAELKVSPFDVGEVPYAIAEWTERLTTVFAESRKYPKNRHIQTKALVIAGILSHYSGDLCMPLHVTNDFDGRTQPDGTSPHSGIHAKVDSLIERLALKPVALAKDEKVAAYPALFPAIEAQMEQSRGKIELTYQLEPQLPPATGDWAASPAIVDFTTERARAATAFTASLLLTAWRNSANLKLPSWYVRDDG